VVVVGSELVGGQPISNGMADAVTHQALVMLGAGQGRSGGSASTVDGNQGW
jgi:hypothetical protein